MAKIHQLQKSQKSTVCKTNTAQKARLPILPGILNWLRVKKARHSNYSYDASWNAAYKIFTMLRSMAKGVKRLEVLIVNSTFKIASTEVDATVMDYSTWLNMILLAEQVRGIHSYTFRFELLDYKSIGAVIRGEHTEVSSTTENLVEMIKIDDSIKPRRSSNSRAFIVEEYYFVYIRDIGLYGMVKAQHQEHVQKNESLDPEARAA